MSPKEVIEDLHKKDIAYRIQLSDIRSQCQKEIYLAEMTGNTTLVDFAQRIISSAKFEEEK